MKDTKVAELIELELKRQRDHIELIASENFVSKDILEAAGSILTNKYAEGYPTKRYYGGCEYIDQIEQLAIDRAKQLFNAEHANVQPHSGSQANAAVYAAVLQHGDKILAMSLDAGGHLTHGHKLSFSGKDYMFMHYGVAKDSELINYDEVEKIALEFQPKMIVAGASAYPRIIDFKRFREIADKVGAYLMVDMAHISGLVAVGLHPSPVPYADFVTTTTHKTIRGPRGGMILCKTKYAAAIDKSVFPGEQGGPLEHIIAAKAICFKEAMEPTFKGYIEGVIHNANILAATLVEEGFRIVSGGTDNHLLLLDLTGSGLTGKEAEVLLDSINITCNKNSIPFDPLPPMKTSGLRLGSAAMTTRGFGPHEFKQLGKIISLALRNPNNQYLLSLLKKQVAELLESFPLYIGV